MTHAVELRPSKGNQTGRDNFPIITAANAKNQVLILNWAVSNKDGICFPIQIYYCILVDIQYVAFREPALVVVRIWTFERNTKAR